MCITFIHIYILGTSSELLPTAGTGPSQSSVSLSTRGRSSQEGTTHSGQTYSSYRPKKQ